MVEIETPVLRNDDDTLKDRLSDNAYNNILPARYLKKNEEGDIIEEQEELFERVAKNIAVAEAVFDEEIDEKKAPEFNYENVANNDKVNEWADKFQDVMEHLKFVPNTPTLINAGTEMQQLSACFVDSPEDDMEDIGDTETEASLIFQSGGGVGYDFGNLRPYGDPVGSTGGIASGPITFMQRYDQNCETVAQGGCVVGDTRIMTEEGYKRISDIHNDTALNPNGGPINTSVQTRSGDYHQVKETSDSGSMEVFEIETEGGYTVRGSFDHPVLTVRDGELEYVEIGDIASDDVVVMDQSTALPEVYAVLDDISENRHFNENEISTPDVLNEDVAFLLGVLWGDGTFDRGEEDRLVFSLGKTEREKPIKMRLEDILSSWDVNYSVTDQNKKERYGDYWRIEVNSKALTDWLKKNELDKNLDVIPEKLYHSPTTIPHFLAGMICDGTYAYDGGVVRYSTISEDFAEDLQELLMLCGVPSKVYSDTKREGAYGDNEIYMVETRAGPSTETFDQVVPHPFDDKLAKGGERQNQVPDVEEIVGEILSDNFTKNNKLPPEVDKKSMKELRRYERGDRTPSRERLVSMLQDVDVEIPNVLSENFWFEPVERVESVGYEYVYDIEMLHDAHEFVGDNFCVHNVRRGAQMGTMPVTHPDIIHFIHAKNRDVSLAHTLRLNDPDDPKYTDFGKAIEEARELIDDEGRVPEHLRNAVEGNLSNFNISVTIPDEFMDAVKNDEDYTLINPRTNEPHIATEETKQMYSWFDFGDEVTVGETLTLPAQEIWTRIIEGAWNNGEPGVMFIDEVNREHSYDTEKNPEYEMTTSNPCAEQNLMEYEACNLGHINLSTIVNENMTPWPKFNTDGRSVETFLDQAIDWAEFNHRIDVGTRFLDNVVTMSDFPIDDIEETVRKNRKIGLGIMGLAQLYIELGVEYGSEEGNEIARQLMKHINHESKRVSHELAEERGVFENWEDSKYCQPYIHNEWMNKHVGSDWQEISDRGKTVGYPIRNHNTTTIAPTGTTSMIGNTSGGCEPIFNVAYYKNVTDDIQGDEMLVEFDSLFLETLRVNDIDVEEAKREAEELMENNEFDGPESLECVPDDIASLFVTTGDLDSQEHASVMCELQKGVDSSISKTLNAPFDATVEDAKETFEYVYDNGGKSVTFYRDGSRTKQVQTTRKDNQDTEDDNDDEMPSPDGGDDLVRQAPKVASGVRYEIETGYGDMFVNIVEDEHGPVELIANVGKSGGTVQSMTEAIGRLVSKSLQNGVSPQEVINQLENIHSPNKGWDEGEGISSVPDGIAVALKRYINTEMNHPTTVSENYEEKVEKVDEQNQENSGEECLECGSMNVQVAEGCATCQDCGYSKCG